MATTFSLLVTVKNTTAPMMNTVTIDFDSQYMADRAFVSIQEYRSASLVYFVVKLY